ncbi:MAG: DUF3368 domain-containing protein [Proteiniphilum sp.]
MHERIVIADTSCLIALTKIQELQLLKFLYREVYITPEIEREFGEELPEWIIIEEVSDKKTVRLLNILLDLGESSAIALGFEKENVLLILDDLKGRKEAEKLGFSFTGTLGVLYRAKKEGYIKMIKPYIDKLKTAEFRISKNIEEEILKLSGEK